MCERKTYRRYVRKLRPTGGFASSLTDGWNCPSKLLNSEARDLSPETTKKLATGNLM
jgi:hypothetical protein